jgi:hypothetical protein
MSTSADFCGRVNSATVRATYIQNQLTIYVNGQIYQVRFEPLFLHFRNVILPLATFFVGLIRL